MKHTDAEIEDAARRFERLADNLGPASVAPGDLSDLRAVAEAAEQVRRDEALVTERVAAVRARGRSWNRIAVALGVSRQAARHRFADKWLTRFPIERRSHPQSTLLKARSDSRSLLRPSRGSERLAPKPGRRSSPTAPVLAT